MKRVEGTRQQSSKAVVERDANLRPEFVKILKTMLLLGRGYGPAYIMHILRGHDEAVSRNPVHLSLETYGSCSLVPMDRLRKILYEMVRFDLVEPRKPYFNVLEITQGGRNYLDDPTDVLVPATNLQFTTLQTFVRMKLRDLRYDRAKIENIAVYNVLTEFTLDQIVQQLPKTTEALKDVPGMNQHKTELLGSAILTIILDAYKLFERIKDDTIMRLATSGRHQSVRMRFREGLSPDEIAKVVGLKRSTVIAYLCNLHRAGHLNLLPWIEANVDKKVLFKGSEYFQKVKDPKLKDAFETLGVDYETLRLCRLYVSKVTYTKEKMAIPA